MLLQLSLIATEQAPAREALEDWKKRIEARDASMENYVDFLLEQPGFINVTAPFLLVRDWAFATQQTPPLNALLKALSRPGMKEPVYYRWLPCAPEQAVRVTPWWGKDPVLVCPDSYRPEVFVDGMHFCDGGVAQDKFDSKLDGVRQICGCGPNLMRCFLTVEQMNRARDAMPEEVRATVAHLVTENQPVELLYTSNETFRTREAEFFYQRERVEAGLQSELADLSSWPEQGQWAPRPEARAGQHAGLLTTPNVLYWSAGVRTVLNVMYERLWCSEPSSTRVEAKTILSLHVADIRRGSGWKVLAHKPICTTCHARLDYGAQFFSGYSDSRVAQHYSPGQQLSGRGPLYGDNADDLRGEAERTPREFAKLAVAQPEFSECMVRRVSEYVLGTLGDPVDTEALSKVFEKQHRLRPLVRAALLRFAERSRAERPTDLPEVQDPQVAVDPQRIRVSRSMRSLIDTNCVGCHENQDDALLGDTVSRSFAEKMLVQVSSGRMPMDLLGMPVQDRRRMVVELASALWSDPLERREAMDHHLQGLDFARVIDSFAVTPLLRARVGVSAPKQRLNFVGLLSASQVFPSPGYVSGVMFEALAACKERGIGNDPVALKGCLSQAAPPDLYTIDR